MTHRLLLLDDDDLFRKMVVPGLQSKGFVVEEAATGTEALSLISSSKFDLLIVDGVLPDTDGIKWITRYKASGGRVPVVFVSGHWQSSEVYEVLTRDLKVSQIIHKPVIPQVFVEQIHSEMSKERWTPSAPAKEEVRYGSVEAEEEAADAALARSMADLMREYMEELPQEIEKMRDGITMAKSGENTHEGMKLARMQSHKLRGTAGSFGLKALGDLMASIEDKIRAHEAAFDKAGNDFYIDLERAADRAVQLNEEAQRKFAIHLSKDSKSAELRTISRILVVAEDETFIESVSRVAKQRLIELVKAVTIDDVIHVLSKKSIDAILIDVNPEEQKSFELVGAIRETAPNDIPIAFVSEDAKLDDRLLAAHLGASLYINKPVDPDSLEDAIQRLMILSSRERPKILIVDDDMHFARRVARILMDRGMETHLLDEPLKILEKLQETPPDILILDLMMPYISGFDICKMLRTMPRWQDLPIIFVTAQTGIDTRIAAFSCGADDYLPKPLSADELVARVTLRVERSRLLRERSERDPVTGLLVRRGFMERFNAALSSAKRLSQPVSLVLFDVDKFKQINDKYGHLAGDAVLAGLGRLMLKRFRVEDLRGRWGGDEFVLAFLGSDVVQSHRLMQGFLEEFSKIDFSGENGDNFHASLSAGIASFPSDCDNAYELLGAADQRLYEAKARGRNRVVSDSAIALQKEVKS